MRNMNRRIKAVEKSLGELRSKLVKVEKIEKVKCSSSEGSSEYSDASTETDTETD